ncbi:hypothetical protein N7474_007965 [Penicillium riverlandense]|uniref:uncharacterized protein n=1 Tax=Penicillium riverlandense TaxID=1903569 RepID=UPI0025465F8B|nr:uncharacterized protein N7474_007965 [Penicillium riverlandense]KAJ5811664.1 hypothetical protein N7474_007965 [Penicillium riverlandense]
MRRDICSTSEPTWQDNVDTLDPDPANGQPSETGAEGPQYDEDPSLWDPEHWQSTPVSMHEDREFKQKIHEGFQSKVEVMNMVLPPKAPIIPDPDHLIKRVHDLRISLALSSIFYIIKAKDYDTALIEARSTLKRAQKLEGGSGSVARCHYYLGRIQFLRKRYSHAYQEFMATQTCCPAGLDIEESPEVEYWLKECRSAIAREQRARLQLPADEKVNGQERRKEKEQHTRCKSAAPGKRKWDPAPFDLVIRSKPQLQTETRHPPVKKEKRPAKPIVWMVPDTEDLPRTRESKASVEIASPSSEGLDWTQTGEPRIKQSRFTVRCYPEPQVPRRRSMSLFKSLPEETSTEMN